MDDFNQSFEVSFEILLFLFSLITVYNSLYLGLNIKCFPTLLFLLEFSSYYHGFGLLPVFCVSVMCVCICMHQYMVCRITDIQMCFLLFKIPHFHLKHQGEKSKSQFLLRCSIQDIQISKQVAPRERGEVCFARCVKESPFQHMVSRQVSHRQQFIFKGEKKKLPQP